MTLIGQLYIVLMVPFSYCLQTWEKFESLGKLAADPKYCLLFADLFTLKVYVYSIKSRKLISAKLEIFYMEVQEKRKGQKTRLQMDQDFKQKKIFDLIKKYNVNMFSTAVRCGKVFASEQKSKELKKGIFRLKVLREKD